MQRPQVNILVLDDDSEQLEFMELIFQHITGAKFTLFTNEKDFISSLNEDVHVTIIDNFINGGAMAFELMHEIKEKSPQAKIIIVSGHTDPRMVVEYLNAGVFRYLDKNHKFFDYLLGKYIESAISIMQDKLEFISMLKKELNVR